MPSNDERREVAAKLREPYPRFTSLVDAFGLTGPVPIHKLRYRLADLIEPEERTCRIYDTDHEFEDSIRCDACQMTFRRPWQPFKFCPNCGAKVVDA